MAIACQKPVALQLLDRRSLVKCLIRSLEIIIIAEGGELVVGAGAVGIRLMKTVDPHSERLEPLFEQIPIDVVDVTG